MRTVEDNPEVRALCTHLRCEMNILEARTLPLRPLEVNLLRAAVSALRAMNHLAGSEAEPK